jgi:hypothetical protein
MTGRVPAYTSSLALRSDPIVDLDRHELHGGFACAAHWDVGFVAIVGSDVEFAASDESEDVRWFATNALPENVPSSFPARIPAVLNAVTGTASHQPRGPEHSDTRK